MAEESLGRRRNNAGYLSGFDPEQVLEMHYKILGLQNEPSLNKLPLSGLSGESVGIETKRALADVQEAIPIYPGIDIDIPTALNGKRT